MKKILQLLRVLHMFQLLAFTFILLLTSPANALSLEDDEKSSAPLFGDDLSFSGLLDVESTVDKELQQVLLLVNQGEYVEAEKIIKIFLAKVPNSAPGYEILGVLQVMAGDLDAGIASFEKSIKLGPEYSSAITKLGEVYWSRGQKDKAVASFQKAVALNPADRRAHQRLGSYYDDTKNIEKAVFHYEKGIIGTAPEYLGIKVDLARLYNKQGKHKEVIALLGGLITEQSKNISGLIALGTASLGTGDLDTAILLFEQANRLAPSKGAVPLGIAYRQAGQLDRSLKVLSEAVSLDANSAILFYQLAETQYALKEYEASLVNYQKSLKLGHPDAMTNRQIGLVYIALKNLDKAIEIYKGLVTEKNAYPKDFIVLGEAYQAVNDLKQAEKTFLSLTSQFPNVPYAWYRLGMHYGFVKQYDKAIQAFTKSLTLQKDNAQFLRALSTAHLQNGDRVKAIELAEQITKIRPESSSELFYLASLYQDDGRTIEAIALYKQILSFHSDHVLSLNNLAGLVSDQGNHLEALGYAQKAVDIKPENGRLLDTLGWIQYYLAQYDIAIKTLLEASVKSSNVPVIYYHLGAAYDAVGNKEAGRKNLQKSLEFSVDFSGRAEAEKLLGVEPKK